jgi:hypothetical protein
LEDDGISIPVLVAPGDVFRVPIMWLMSDSIIDLYLVKKTPINLVDDFSQPKIELFKNISRIFCKTARDKERLSFCEGLESKIVEINDDFYMSVDIQGYNCLPRIS